MFEYRRSAWECCGVVEVGGALVGGAFILQHFQVEILLSCGGCSHGDNLSIINSGLLIIINTNITVRNGT